ncbi:MAG: DUF5658 family protein [Nitrososphaerota archaeon]
MKVRLTPLRLLLALTSLNTADMLTSYYAVRIKGATELNPVVAFLTQINPAFFFIYKALIPWVILFFFIVYSEKEELRRVAMALLLYLAYVVINNVILLILP